MSHVWTYYSLSQKTPRLSHHLHASELKDTWEVYAASEHKEQIDKGEHVVLFVMLYWSAAPYSSVCSTSIHS